MEPNTFISLLLFIGLLTTAFFLIKKYPILSFAIFWFFLTLSVESFVAQRNFIFEHRLYLQMVGLCLFLVVGLSKLAKTGERLSLTVLVIAALFSAMTYQRNFVWRNDLALWDDVVLKFPKKGRAYNGRGDALLKMGHLKEALKVFDLSLELQPDNPEAFSNRGYIYGIQGKYDKALADFNTALGIKEELVQAYRNRAIVYTNMGLQEKALADFNKAIELEPGFAKDYCGRGTIYAMNGVYDKALLDLNMAIQLEPSFAGAYFNRANLHLLKKEYALSWDDVAKAQALGFAVDPKFIEELTRASIGNQ